MNQSIEFTQNTGVHPKKKNDLCEIRRKLIAHNLSKMQLGIGNERYLSQQ